jgi:hypothetical protein
MAIAKKLERIDGGRIEAVAGGVSVRILPLNLGVGRDPLEGRWTAAEAAPLSQMR